MTTTEPHNGDAGGNAEVQRLNAVVADLKTQRTQLFAEVERLKQERNAAIAACGRRSAPAPSSATEDTFRRIRNILDVCPAEDWTSEEAKAVLAALEAVVRGRHPNGGL